MSEMIPVHPQFYAQTQERISEIEAQLLATQAEAASMREALEDVAHHLAADEASDCLYHQVSKALAPDAGKALLERLEKAECKAARELDVANLVDEWNAALARAEKAEAEVQRAWSKYAEAMKAQGLTWDRHQMEELVSKARAQALKEARDAIEAGCDHCDCITYFDLIPDAPKRAKP